MHKFPVTELNYLLKKPGAFAPGLKSSQQSGLSIKNVFSAGWYLFTYPIVIF